MYDILYPSITICGDDGFGEFVVVLYPHVRNVWKIVSRPLPAAFVFASCQLQGVLVKPERFEEAASIGDNLNAKRTVVLNLESTNRDIARRLLDFLSGVAYANNGQIKRVANSTYIITPYNVDVMGDLIDELENNGMFM